MHTQDSKFRPDHSGDEGHTAAGAASAAGASSDMDACRACGAVSDEAVAAVAERLGEGVGK